MVRNPIKSTSTACHLPTLDANSTALDPELSDNSQDDAEQKFKHLLLVEADGNVPLSCS